MKFFICLNHSTIMTTPLEKAVLTAEKAGFDGFDLWRQNLEEYLKGKNVKELAKLFNSLRIKPVCLTGIGDFMQTTPDEFEKTKKRIISLFEVLKELGVNIVVINQANMRWDYQDSLKIAVERVQQLSEVAIEYDIKLALEYLGFSDFISCMKRALILYNEVKSENAGLLVDTYHMYKAGDQLNELEEIPYGSVFFVHIANVLDIPRAEITDAQREYPSEGKLDLLPVLKLLKSKGYSGYLSIELFRKNYWKEDPLKVARLARESTVNLINGV
ncbi:MAG: TIM barrel protein [Clostridia bacterium]|nr:TIM barrel protein [Clostridia bacterium]